MLFRPPDLEHIPDRRYRDLIERAICKRRDAVWLIPLSVFLAVIFALSILNYALITLVAPTGAKVNWSKVWFAYILIASPIAFGAASLVRWRMITASIRRLVDKASCPYCEFSLKGLVVEKDTVTCPECGQRVVLHENNLTPEDLLIASNTPFDAAGKLGAYTGAIPQNTSIRPDKHGRSLRTRQHAEKPSPTDVLP